MKKAILLFLLILSVSGFAQKATNLTVSIQKQTIDAPLDSDNATKQINVYSNTRSTDQLKINNPRWGEEKDWKRTFQIFDSVDNALLKIPASNQFSYQVSVKQLRASLKKGGTYSIYTMAIPKDPKVAATVRVKRVLVCRINVK